jgi:hypothetical protein
MKTIERPCLVCGTVLEITVDDDGQYSGGYYFGELENTVGDGDYKKVDEIDLIGRSTDVVKWTGETETVEYWECRECHHGPEPPKTR